METTIPIEGFCATVLNAAPFCSEEIASWTSQALFSVLENSPFSSLLSNAAIPPAIPCVQQFIPSLLLRKPHVTVTRMGLIRGGRTSVHLSCN